MQILVIARYQSPWHTPRACTMIPQRSFESCVCVTSRHGVSALPPQSHAIRIGLSGRNGACCSGSKQTRDKSPRRRDSNRTVRTAPQRRLNGFARHASMSSAFTLRSCVSSCASLLRRSCSKRYARRAGVCALAACVSRVSSIASSRRPDSLSRPHVSGQFSSVILVG